MWVNGKTADLAEKNKSLSDAPGRSQVAYQVAGANSGPLKNGRYYEGPGPRVPEKKGKSYTVYFPSFQARDSLHFTA